MEEAPVPVTSPQSAPFWEGAAGGRLVIQRCTACEKFVFYPRRWCSHCYGTAFEWIEVSGRGEVHTFSVIHGAPSVGFEERVPYVLAVVELEEGPHLMANVVDCDPDVVRVGLPVRVVFEARGDYRVPQFTPV